MENVLKSIRYLLYSALILGAVSVTVMGYHQVEIVRSEKAANLTTTWVPKKEIKHLMRYHGTDGLKVTKDEVYIYRNHKWIPVLKRGRG